VALNPLIKSRRSGTVPAGESKGPWLALLEQGANVLQSATPMHGFDVYVVGFHCAKGEPDMQMEAHHFCRVVNGEFMQCALFDGNTKDANLIGIEYIVSERLFDGMPVEEKGYWHPHNYELFSGELVAPGLPEAAEKAFFQLLVNSYGKTWHTWHTHSHGGHPAMDLPYGDPTLMWSFNREGECDPALRRDRDQAMGIDSDAKRADRQSLLDLAHPQWGVDTMKADFPGARPIPGVLDVNSVRGPG
jgi:Protein of unknown function (DUF1264)